MSNIQSLEDQTERHLRREKSKFKVPDMGISYDVQETERILYLEYVSKRKVIREGVKDHIR